MKFETYIGLRYLWNSRRTRFFSMITIISVLGITIGVAALITVQSVIDGFQGQMKKSILGSKAHAKISVAEGKMTDYEAAASKVRNINGVTGVSPIVSNEIMVSANQEMLGGYANGIDIKTIGSASLLPSQIEKGRIECLGDISLCKDLFVKKHDNPALDFYEDFAAKEQGEFKPVLIGKEMAKYLSVRLGDVITVISPIGGGIGPAGPVPLSRSFKIAGLFYTGMYEYDFNYIYMNLPDAQDFFSMKGAVSFLNIKVKDIYDIDAVSTAITSSIGSGYNIQTWKEMNKSIFGALKMEKTVMFLILGFIILVASFNIVAALIMMVMGKTREISILKALGASNRSIMKIFMLCGLIIGASGAFLGMILGAILCNWLNGMTFTAAQDVYYMTSLPVDMSLTVFMIVGVSSLAVSLIATVYPSLFASRIRPAEGLRFE